MLRCGIRTMSGLQHRILLALLDFRLELKQSCVQLGDLLRDFSDSVLRWKTSFLCLVMGHLDA